MHIHVYTHFIIPTLLPEQMGENEKENNWLALEKNH